MKVRCLENCTGVGYEKFKVGEERELPEALAKKLINFGYVEAVKKSK